MIYVLDTNIFLRFFVHEDEKDFAECKRLLNNIKLSQVKAVVPGIVLAEIGWVLGSYYETPRTEVAKKIEGIIKHKGLEIVDEYDWLEAVKLHESENVKLIDAIVATIPKVTSKEWTIVSYDKDFKKLPVLWKTPRQVT
jgi:predicted nucleic acid-binding protein